MLERIDDHYVKRRVAKFGSDEGNLWKCVYGADFRNIDPGKIGPDSDDKDFPYELKENEGTFEEAAAQLKNFILNVSQLNDEDFYKWIQRVCDVELLLKTYAVNVALGMWDDHWNNSNNFYIYFNSNSSKDYKFFFIPYDYDNTLGTSHVCGAQTDSGRHDPYDWGNHGILIERLMKYDDFREIYRAELMRMIDPSNGFMDYDSAVARIRDWHGRIQGMTSNDTGDGMEIKDRPASWGNHPEYRLLDPDPNVNFFKVKAETIKKMK
jgi:spore coat protein CotH